MSDNSEPKIVAPQSRRKRLLQNLALSGVVFLLCIAAFEFVLRLCGYGKLGKSTEPGPKTFIGSSGMFWGKIIG